MSPKQKRYRQREAAGSGDIGDLGAAGSTCPQPGCVYGALPEILIGGDAHSAHRRIGMIRELPGLPSLWRAIGRTTTDSRPGDLESPVDLACNLDKKGWWSKRFMHTIFTTDIGNKVRCPHYGELSAAERTKVIEYAES